MGLRTTLRRRCRRESRFFYTEKRVPTMPEMLSPNLESPTLFDSLTKKWFGAEPPAHQTVWLWVIVVGAFGFRLAAGLMHGVHVDRDTVTFANQALALADGQWAQWFYIHTKPPVFCFFIAGGVRLGVDALWAAQTISLVAGVLMLHPTWLLLGRISKGPVRLLALAIVAFCFLEVRISGRALSETTYACILLYSFYLGLYRGVIDRKIIPLISGGILLGLAFLTRSEAIIYLPMLPVIAAAALWQKRMSWRFAAATCLYPLFAILTLGPQVALLSQYEGHFLVRRNAVQFVAKSIDRNSQPSQVLSSPQDEDRSGASAAATPTTGIERAKGLLVTVSLNLIEYARENIPRAFGYVAVFFLPIGLLYWRRKLFHISEESLCVFPFFWTILLLSPMDAHTRFLTAVLPLVVLPTAIGMILVMAWIVQKNPARLSLPKQLRAEKHIIVLLLLGVILPTVGKVLSRDYYEGHDLIDAGARIQADQAAVPGHPKGIVAQARLIAYQAKAEEISFSEEDGMNAKQLRAYVATHPTAGYLAVSKKYLETTFPEFPNLPAWLTYLDLAQSHPKAKRKKYQYLFRIQRDQLDQ
jgi:4-amino-4-deoxy-L-arabinose transferase-like glycosyltransferase